VDPRWQPHLDHPAAGVTIDHHARELYAAGWMAATDEGLIMRSRERKMVEPETWRNLRELRSLQTVPFKSQES